jgi:hypothetical protein
VTPSSAQRWQHWGPGAGVGAGVAAGLALGAAAAATAPGYYGEGYYDPGTVVVVPAPGVVVVPAPGYGEYYGAAPYEGAPYYPVRRPDCRFDIQGC